MCTPRHAVVIGLRPSPLGGSGVVPFFPLFLFFFMVEALKEKNEVLTPVASSLVPGLLLGWFFPLQGAPPGQLSLSKRFRPATTFGHLASGHGSRRSTVQAPAPSSRW